VPTALPPLVSDRQKVKQIVLNLFNNALKFTPHGSISVDASYDAATGLFKIAVQDTGIGIDPKDHARVFEDFQQVDSSPARQYTGAGLGLSICRRLASVLGGQIALESKLGEGARFTLTLPRKQRKRG
jgi:signal transduction histidine kinase